MTRLTTALCLLILLSACADGPKGLPRMADAACDSGERYVRPHAMLHAKDGIRTHPDRHECVPVGEKP